MGFNAAQSIKNLFKPVDLTKGKPYKQLIIFMIPILISYIFQQVYTISDAAIVGKYLSAAEVSGVNVVYSLIYIVLQFAFLILFVGIFIYLIKGKAFKDINAPKIEESHQADAESSGKSLAK